MTDLEQIKRLLEEKEDRKSTIALIIMAILFAIISVFIIDKII